MVILLSRNGGDWRLLGLLGGEKRLHCPMGTVITMVIRWILVPFAFTAAEAGGIGRKVAKKGQVEAMVLEFKKMYDAVTSIHDEMFYLREREEGMQQLNRETNSKMATFSFFSLLFCLSVAALQLWHLKAFFESKKLL
ncbi:emp24/gp25L/p24 family/GOLD family protein [Actinidia rufa]|uniref:Emp24/gp25L/p24 family/GOLD family protein n=1 Tax=Actinidia rufa TaxID=165716 RepID=A0A7J0EEG6_9ERIC|nr:emp24/gp25L/p24 family/GOLD family protein [Actinidia rufa]